MTTCPGCGLKLIGGRPHDTAADCLRHLAPRYKLAQAALESMHARYRNLEARLERARIHERAARQVARKNGTIPARLEAVEAALGIRKEQTYGKLAIETTTQ